LKLPERNDDSRAALYVLGALPEDQAAAFAERLRSSPALRAEVEELRAAAAELALAATPVAPRAAVRERLLERATAEARRMSPPPDLLFALQADAEWIQVAPGLEARSLFRRGPHGTAYLLRVAPGATIPQHDHGRVEHSYVLSGSIEVEGLLCHAGDYHRAAAGTAHHAFHSAEGCVLLVVGEASPAS